MDSGAQFNDAIFRARLRAALEQGGRNAGDAFVKHLRLKINIGAISYIDGVKLITPSEPGEPPRRRTGDFQKSIHALVETDNTGGPGRPGSKMAYPRPLECGAKSRKRILKPRPWLRPGLEEFKDTFK